MNTGLLVVLFLLMVLGIWVYSFVRGRPWTVRGLHTRTFLGFALSGPELLTTLGILEKLGIHCHNARLSNASEAFADRQYRRIRRDLAILRSYPRASQAAATGLSTDIMDWFLDNQVRDETWRYHDYPLNQMFGAQSQLPDFMMNIHPVTSALEGRNYVKRLSRFGIKLGQILDGLRIRQAKGIIPPRFVIQKVLEQMRAFIAHDARQHPLCTVFDGKLAKLPRLDAGRRQMLVDAVAIEITRTVYPAYQALIDYFDCLLAKATEDDGVWKLPAGQDYYAHCLRSSTTTAYTPEAVHATGLAEVERIEAQMRAIFASIDGSQVSEPTRRLAELGSDPRFQYPNDDAGRTACLAEYSRILDDMSARLDPYFAIKPKARLEVQRIPAFKEKTAPGAYYMIPDLGGARPGVFYANLRDMREVHRFGMKTLAYHEGIPGHHFQLALALEQRRLPLFRRLLPFTAYAEGWAMYAELLAREMGLYEDDPYSLLGSLDAELFRAVRLVVDTGIHHKRWTRAQAIEYMTAHSAQAPESVVSEIERYIVMPGQACAYKVGMIKIVELRERARARLGERFDIREFHAVILGNGAMPLELLDRQVDGYIQRSAHDKPTTVGQN